MKKDIEQEISLHMQACQSKIEKAIATLCWETWDKQYNYSIRVTQALDTIKQDVTRMVRVVKQSHLLLTDAIVKLEDNSATTLEKVVGRLNKLKEQYNNYSNWMWSLKFQAPIAQLA